LFLFVHPNISGWNVRNDAMAKYVLIVDDAPNIVLSLEFLMKKEGYDVYSVSNGEEAMAAVAEKIPDLILLDVMMPRKDGYEVCQELRANPDWRQIKIIMLTAKGRDVEREKGLALGADDYVTKPFATQELIKKVKILLD
jgi:DNA-binding response OmpR family regulator